MKFLSFLILTSCLFIFCSSPSDINDKKVKSLEEKTEVKKEKVVLNTPNNEQRSIVITIDDLPGISLESYSEVNNKLLTTLKKFKVPAIGFVNEGKLYRRRKLNQSRLDLLEDWLEVGMELGNHTYSHPDYHKLTFEKFTADLIKGEKHTKQLQIKHGQNMRYFRHPYLHVGNSTNKKERLEKFLEEHDYINAPVTIDNSEWIFAKAYHLSLKANETEQMKKIGNAYIKYMQDMTIYYEQQSKQLFDRPMKHSLLIHANALNGDYLDELLEMYAERGYRFISMADALTDTAYQSSDTYTGRRGISWLHRWALTQKVDKSFFKGEPTCPDFIQSIAGIQE